MARVKKSSYAMKAGPEGPMVKNFPSAFPKKPSKEELREAANNPNNPNHPSKFKTRAEYYAWKAGGTIVPTKPESKTYHGAGGKVMNPDGTVNEEITASNVAHLQ